MDSPNKNESQTASDSQQQEEESFAFGQYVSPTPKRIALGVKFQPDPQIEYKRKHEVKTESKAVSQRVPDDVAECKSQESVAKKALTRYSRDQCLEMQQSEIESLKAKLMALQIENKRLMTFGEPQHDDHDHDRDGKDKRICFNPAVEVVDAEPSKSSNVDQAQLTDKVSKVRSTRNSTPYKANTSGSGSGKSKGKASGKAKGKKSGSTREDSTELPAELPPELHVNHPDGADLHHASSRNNYRTTPIPLMQRRPRYTSNQRRTLSTIFDHDHGKSQENAAANKENMQHRDQQPKPIPEEPERKTDRKKEKESQQGKHSTFNLGRGARYPPEMSPKPVRNTKVKQLGPLLTPVKGANTTRTPFSFSWNSNKPEKEKKQEK